LAIAKRIIHCIASLFVPVKDRKASAGSSIIAKYVCFTLLVMYALLFIASFFVTVDISFADTSQQNIPPTFSLTDHPQNADMLSAGSYWNIAVSDGKIIVSGEPPFDVPPDLGNDNVSVSAGHDHALILDSKGKLSALGLGIYGECDIPEIVYEGGEITAFAAGYHESYVAFLDGSVYSFGISGTNKVFEGAAIKKVEPLYTSGALLLDENGCVHCIGNNNLEKAIPKNDHVIDIAASGDRAAILYEDGTLRIYRQSADSGFMEPLGKYTALSAGMNHFAAINTDGEAVIFSDSIKTLELKKKVSQISCGGYQTFVIYEDGSVDAFGRSAYPLGTDQLGRDMLSRVLKGGRTELSIALLAAAISTLLGTLIGSISGYKGGIFDFLLMRITEIIGSLPLLPLIMLISAFAVNLEQSQRTLILILMLGLLGWPNLARLVRAQALSIRESDYILAANAMGIKPLRTALFHIAPNLASTIAVNATLLFSRDILTQTSLSYLGLGVSPPHPTWGNMLSAANSSNVIRNFPWQWIFSALLIALIVICVNALGEWLSSKYEDK